MLALYRVGSASRRAAGLPPPAHAPWRRAGHRAVAGVVGARSAGSSPATGRSIARPRRVGAGGSARRAWLRAPRADRRRAVRRRLPRLPADGRARGGDHGHPARASPTTPQFIRRFEAEAELVARLEHPHIVPLYDYWREPDAAYLVTRLFRGGSLADAVGRTARRRRGRARLASDIGSALALAHRRGVVHGAIKPANILLDDDRRAYLTDFAIAGDERAVGASSGGPTVRCARAAAGRRPRPSPTCTASRCRGLRAHRSASPSTARRRRLPAAIAGVIERGHGRDRRSAPPMPRSLRRRRSTPPCGARRAAPTAIRDRAVATRTRACAPSTRPTPPTSSAASGSSNGSWPGSASPARGAGSWRSSARAAAASRAWSTPGCCPPCAAERVPGSHDWFVVTMSPGATRSRSWRRRCCGSRSNPPPSLLDQLTDGDGGIRRAVQRVLPDDGSPLLLVIDQFEELFTQATPATAHAFLDALRRRGRRPARPRCGWCVTLRADFYDRPLRHRAVRRAAAPRHRSHHADGAGRARAGDRRSRRAGRRALRAGPRRRHRGRRRRPRRRPAAAAVRADRAVRPAPRPR